MKKSLAQSDFILDQGTNLRKYVLRDMNTTIEIQKMAREEVIAACEKGGLITESWIAVRKEGRRNCNGRPCQLGDCAEYRHGHGRYCDIGEVVSRVSNDRGRKIAFIVTGKDTPETVTKKASRLRKRARAQQALNKRRHLREARMIKQRRSAEEERVRQWVPIVREAFGGAPNERLSDDKAPQQLTLPFLQECGRLGVESIRLVAGNEGVQVALPPDLADRAKFLMLLDGFLRRNAPMS